LKDMDFTGDPEGDRELLMPLLSLGLILLPVLLVFLSPHFRAALPLLILLVIALPIAGFILGIQSLCLLRGKKAFPGKLIAIVAVVLPPASLVFIVILFTRAVTTGIANM